MRELPKGLRPFNELAGLFECNRGFHAAQAAQAIVHHLAAEGWRLKSLDAPPQPHLSPDVVIVLEDGRRFGIEVTELVDPDYAQRARAVKEGRAASLLARYWDAASVEAEVRAALLGKDAKRRKAILSDDSNRCTWGEPLHEYVVVVHTDEDLITSQPHAALTQMDPVACSHVTRAFFILWYAPREIGPRPRIYEIPILS